MTTEEKLEHFLNLSIEEAKKESQGMLDDYRAALNKIYETHKADTIRRSNLQIKLESDNIKRNINRHLASEELDIKRTLSQKKAELTDKLFVEVRNLLERYMTTAEYDNLLISQIQHAKAFAKDNEIILYIDPADSARMRRLEASTSTKLTISEMSFGGGTRAVIRAKNVLIDNSFDSKIRQARESFSLDF